MVVGVKGFLKRLDLKTAVVYNNFRTFNKNFRRTLEINFEYYISDIN